MHGTRMFTLLAGPPEGFRGVPAGGWAGEAGRRQRLVGIRDPGGIRRRLFGVGEGPAKAVAEAKQERVLGFNRGSGGLLSLGRELSVLDRSCQYSQFVDVPETCANLAPLVLVSSSGRPLPVL